MKKIYVSTVVFLLLALTGSAQTYYWIGGTGGGNWNNVTNWSLSSGGAAGTAYPHLTTENAVFDGAASVSLNVNIDLSTLTITGNSSVKITATGGPTETITLNSTSAATPGLQIDGGSKLETDAASNVECVFNFIPGGQGSVSGEWLTSGNDALNSFAYFILPTTGSTALNFNNGGKLTIGRSGLLYDNANSDNFLIFKSGSTLEIKTDPASVPKANYDNNSTILISGLVNYGLAIDETGNIGNLTYNCPGQSSNLTPLSLLNLNINGDVNILNTNSNELTLLANGGPSLPLNTVGIKGSLNISGTSKVIESKVDGIDKTMTLNVQGDFNAGGISFNLQNNNDNLINPTSLVIKGDFHHTAGSFGASSTAVNESQSIFNVEFNGSTTQTISSSSGTIDNANHQVSLKVNNALGVTLNSSMEVGRIDFSGGTPGKLNTSLANYLTINNTSGNAIVVNSPSNSAYVNGPVRRKTLSTSPVDFPSGTGDVLRALTITPNSAAANTFQVNLITGNKGGTVLSPLSGLSPYYWDVTRPSGTASAIVTMKLVGAIAGASATDTLVAAAYDGTNWIDARGATGNNIFPGTSVAGSLATALQSSFNSFAIGYKINSALFIKLLSFTGKKLQNSAELDWTITENSTPSKFEIVKSENGISFSSIGSLPGLDGKLNYGFTDNTLSSGNNYYRLKMYDKDGSISFSNIIIVMNGSKGVMISSMIPTLVRDRARLNISSSVRGNMQLVVTDISGRIMQNQVVSISSGNQEVWLNATSLSAGMFQVTGYINGEKTATFRFIKQ